MSYYLNVREPEPPHKVIGSIAVPYQAAIGGMKYVQLEERVPVGKRVDQWTMRKLHTLEVHCFVVNGHTTFGFKMTPAEFETLKEKLG